METENTENPHNTTPHSPGFVQLWPRWASNRYVLSGAAFALWMAFLDSNSLVLHWDLHREQKRLEREIRHYRTEIRQDSTRLYELTGNPQALEKFARERYWLARADEQIYWVEEDD